MSDINPQAALFGALAKAQSEMKNAPLNKVNPHFKSRYADLSAIRDAVIPALTKNSLCVFQSPTTIDGQQVLVTTIAHSLGGVIQSETPICSDTSKPQPYGSALTYARRYGLAAICNISADEDDDANAAQSAPAAPEKLITPENAKIINDLIERKGANAEAFMKYFGVSTVSELPQSKYVQAKDALEKKQDVGAE
jgi:hypothetical protein